jgi:hypothetical protein
MDARTETILRYKSLIMKCREKGKFERAIKLKKGLEDYANRKR